MSELTEDDLEFKKEFEESFKKLKNKYGYVVVSIGCCYICADSFKYFEKYSFGKLGEGENIYVFYYKGNIVAITEFECINGTLKDVEICEKVGGKKWIKNK